MSQNIDDIRTRIPTIEDVLAHCQGAPHLLAGICGDPGGCVIARTIIERFPMPLRLHVRVAVEPNIAGARDDGFGGVQVRVCGGVYDAAMTRELWLLADRFDALTQDKSLPYLVSRAQVIPLCEAIIAARTAVSS